MKQFILFFFIGFLVIANYAYSQDTITLINGKQIAAISIPDSESTNIYYNVPKKDETLKLKKVDLLDVYSMKIAGKPLKIIYKQDSLLGYELSFNDMTNFIKGEQHAIKYFKSPLAFPVGFLAAPVAVIYTGYYGLLSPAVVATAIGLKTPKLKKPELISESLRNDKNFIQGYRIQATKAKVRNAIFGGIAGVAMSIILLTVISK